MPNQIELSGKVTIIPDNSFIFNQLLKISVKEGIHFIC